MFETTTCRHIFSKPCPGSHTHNVPACWEDESVSSKADLGDIIHMSHEKQNDDIPLPIHV